MNRLIARVSKHQEGNFNESHLAQLIYDDSRHELCAQCLNYELQTS
jgi:hypothetical protein